MINARSETAAAKPAFPRSHYATVGKLASILADGFYEWQKQGRNKQPIFIHRSDDAPFAFAGLWERWKDAQQQPLETFTILTTAASDQLRPLHERMPIIMRPENYTKWLDPTSTDPAALEPLLNDPPQELVLQPVGLHVNSVVNDDPTCIAPAQMQRTLWN